MNVLALGWWITFDLMYVFFFLWAILKIPNRKLSYSFLYLLTAGGIYFNTLFVKWISPWGDENPVLLTRMIFMSGILIHSAFAAFVVAFGGKPEWSKNVVFRIIQVLLLAAAATAAFTPLVIADVSVQNVYPRFQASHGALYIPVIAFLACVGVAALSLFYVSWRACQVPFQKFQIGATLLASGVIFVCMTVTNGLIPAITQKSYFSVFGGIFPMLFFAAVLYLLAYGEAIQLKREFARLLGSGLSLHKDNQIALKEVIQALRSLLHKGAEQVSRQIRFRVKPDTLVDVTVEHAAARATKHSSTSIVSKSLANSLRYLYTENQRMFFSLIRAESLIEEKWLTEDIQQGFSANTRLREIPGLGEEELDANLAEFKAFWGYEMVCSSPENFVLLQKLEKRKNLTHPLIITGESATGKALLCRALHHIRGDQPILEFSARLEDARKVFDAIGAAAENTTGRGTGILIRHADNLGQEGLKTLWAFMDKYAETLFFYITGGENFIAQVGEQGLLARLTTLEVKSVPLRKRPEDIELLSLYFARRFAQKNGRKIPRISGEAVQKLKRHTWPGNITELREIIENTVAATKSDQINDIRLPALLPDPGETLSPLEAGERLLISQYLAKNHFNKNRTRIELGITVNTLNAKIQKYGLLAPSEKE